MSNYSVLNAHRLQQSQGGPPPLQSATQSSVQPSGQLSQSKHVVPGASAGFGSKVDELLEGVKREYDKLASDAAVWKAQRDEMESKVLSQIQETQLMKQSLWDLEAAHVKIRQEYEHELAHLRRLLDGRNAIPPSGPSSTLNSASNRNSLPPASKSSKPASSLPSHPSQSSQQASSTGLSSSSTQQLQQHQQASYAYSSGGPPVLPPAGPAPGGAGGAADGGADRGGDRKERFLGAPPGAGGLTTLKGKDGAESPNQSMSHPQPPLPATHPGPNSASSITSQPLPSVHRDRAPEARSGTPVSRDQQMQHLQQQQHQQQPSQPPPSSVPSVSSGSSRIPGSTSFSGNLPPPPVARSSTNNTNPANAPSSQLTRPPNSQDVVPQPHTPPSATRAIVSDIDPEATAKELRKEGGDWVVTWSPKVKKAMDVSLKHTFVHDSVVCCVRFSYDGKWVATGCNKTVQIFDTATGMKNCVLLDETSTRGDLYIRTLCFSPSGLHLATGAEDRQIRIWDIAKRRIRHLLQGHTQEIYSLEFSSDGKTLASGSGDKSVRIWDVESGACRFDLKVDDFVLQEMGPVDAGLTSISISPDSRLVAGGCLDSQVRIWDIKTGVQIARLSGHTDSVYSIAFSPDGNFLCSGSLDRTIRVWDLSGPRPQTVQGGPKPDPMPNGEPGQSYGALWSVLGGHKDYVLSVAVSTDNRWVVSGSKDRSIQFFDVSTGQVQLMLNGHKNSVISIDLSKNGGLLASGSGDMNARVWSYTPI